MQKIKRLQEEAGNANISTDRLKAIRTEIEAEAANLENLKQQYVSAMQTAERVGMAIGTGIRTAARGLAAVARHVGTFMASALRSSVGVAGRIGSAFVSMARRTGSMMLAITRRVGSSLVGIIRSAGNAMRGFGQKIGSFFISRMRQAGTATQGFGQKIYGLLRNVIVFQLLQKAFSALVSYIKEGVSAYIAQDSQLRASIEQLKASLNTLKGSLGSAFAPILSVVVPALQTLVNWAITAANAVAAFIAAITGKSTYKVAVAGLDNVSSSAGGAADNMANAAGAAKELTKALAGYDELSVIDSPNSGGGGGGGGGGGAGSGGSGSITYADADISSDIAKFAEKIKEAWRTADFTEIGKIIGEKLNSGLKAIPWEGIQDTARKVGKSLATLINGGVEVEDLGTNLGKTLAEAINTGLFAIEDFTTNLKFPKVGQFIADEINGALERIRWESAITSAGNLGAGIAEILNKTITSKTFTNVGRTVANAVNTAVAGASSYIKTANFAQYGTAISNGIKEAVARINWDSIKTSAAGFGAKIADGLNSLLTKDTFASVGTAVSNLINAALETAAAFFGRADFGAWATNISTGINTALTGIDWTKALSAAKSFGKNIAAALNGFISVDNFKTIGSTISEAINTAVSGFSAFLDTSKFLAWGTAVSSGINEALSGINWENALSAASTLGTKIADALNGLFDVRTFSTIGDTVANAINAAILAGRSFFTSANFALYGQSVGSAIISALNGINWESAKLGFQTFAEKISDFLSSFFTTEMFTSAGNAVAEAVNTAVVGAKTFFQPEKFYSFGRGLGSAVISAVNSIEWDQAALGFKNFASSIANAINGFLTKENLSSIGEALGNTVQSVIEGAYTFVTDAEWTQWGNAIAYGVNNFFNNLDWKTVGLTLTNAAYGILNLMREAVSGISWYALGANLAEAIKNIDWGTVLKSAADLVVEVFKGLLDFGKGFTADSWELYMREVNDSTEQLRQKNEEIKGIVEDASKWNEAGETPEFTYLTKLAEEYGKLQSKVDLTDNDLVRMQEISTKLKEAVSDLEAYYNPHTKLLEANESAILAVIEAMKQQAIQAAARDAMEDLYRAEAEALINRGKAIDQYQRLAGQYSNNERSIESLTSAIAPLEQKRKSNIALTKEETEEYARAKQQIGDLEVENWNLSQAMKDHQAVIEDSNAAYQAAEAEIENVTNYLTAQITKTDESADSTKKAADQTERLKKSLSDLSQNSQIAIQASMQGFDPDLNAKISVIAEVTGLDQSKLPKDERTLKNMYGEIVKIYNQGGIPTIDANGNIVDATDKTGGKATVTGAQNTTKANDKTNGKASISGTQYTYSAVDKTGGKASVTGTAKVTKVQDGIPAAQKVVNNMTSRFAGWMKDAKFSSFMAMSSNFTGWKKDGKFNSAMTMSATFASWLKGTGFKSSIGNMIANFESRNIAKTFPNLITQTAFMQQRQLPTTFPKLISQTAYMTGKQLSNGFGGTINQTAFFTGKEVGYGVGSYINQTAYLDGKEDHIPYKSLDNFTALITEKEDRIPWTQRVLDGFRAMVDNVIQRASGGIYQNGTWANLGQFASGGIIRNGTGSWWNGIAKYAGGTNRAHGSLFVAGEAGPEVVGHVGGRTEVLNKSQIASAIYQAVVAGIANAVGMIIRPIVQNNVNCANAIGSVLLGIADQIQAVQYQPYRMDFVPDTARINDANRAYYAASVPAMGAAMQTGSNGAVQYVFTANLDGREIFREVVDQNDLYRNQVGRSAFA